MLKLKSIILHDELFNYTWRGGPCLRKGSSTSNEQEPPSSPSQLLNLSAWTWNWWEAVLSQTHSLLSKLGCGKISAWIKWVTQNIDFLNLWNYFILCFVFCAFLPGLSFLEQSNYVPYSTLDLALSVYEHSGCLCFLKMMTIMIVMAMVMSC